SGRKVLVRDFLQRFEHLELVALQRHLEQDCRLYGRTSRNGAGDLPHVHLRAARKAEALARPRLHALDRLEALRGFPGRSQHRMSLSDACENAPMAHPDRFLLAGVMGWPVMHSRSPAFHNYWMKRHGLAGTYVPLAIRPEHLAGALRGL